MITARRPAEWEPHKATVLAWPHNRDTWPGDRLHRVEAVFSKLLLRLCHDEPVWLLVADDRSQARAQAVLTNSPHASYVKIIPAQFNDMWVRDSGPIAVKYDERTTFLNFRFNSWGGKYPPWEQDDRLPVEIGELMNYPVQNVPLTLEGGAIECNGKGTLITTKSVLLHSNRNNGDKEVVEQQLKDVLGVEQIIWLAGGLAGDDTDGHVDDLVRFVDESTVVAVSATSKSDPNYEILQENNKRLKEAVNADGSSLHIIELPMPETVSDEPTVDGNIHTPASYANFYITNQSVLIPLYDERYDRQVLKLFEDLFPERNVTGIEARDLVWGQGGFHCITQEIYI